MTRDEFILKKLWPEKCWHESHSTDLHNSKFCEKCGAALTYAVSSNGKKILTYNPNFSTWEGFGILWEAMSKRMDWAEFVNSKLSYVYHHFYFLNKHCINPDNVADKVAEYFGCEGDNHD